jgi:hypothetical protein
MQRSPASILKIPRTIGSVPDHVRTAHLGNRLMTFGAPIAYFGICPHQ